MFDASLKLQRFYWCFLFKLILHLAMLVHQNRRQKVFNKRGFTFVQAGLNATALFIFSVSYFNLGELRPHVATVLWCTRFLLFCDRKKHSKVMLCHQTLLDGA